MKMYSDFKQWYEQRLEEFTHNPLDLAMYLSDRFDPLIHYHPSFKWVNFPILGKVFFVLPTLMYLLGRTVEGVYQAIAGEDKQTGRMFKYAADSALGGVFLAPLIGLLNITFGFVVLVMAVGTLGLVFVGLAAGAPNAIICIAQGFKAFDKELAREERELLLGDSVENTIDIAAVATDHRPPARVTAQYGATTSQTPQDGVASERSAEPPRPQ